MCRRMKLLTPCYNQFKVDQRDLSVRLEALKWLETNTDEILEIIGIGKDFL